MKLKNKIQISLFVIMAFAIMALTNCRKNTIITDASANINFSADTLLFDTIFTTIGSTTKYFKIYNNNAQKIIVSRIELEQGTNSMFRINVDGDAGVSFNELEIAANDSAFVFVEVTIDPNGGTIPLVVEDKIHFTTNGNVSSVILNAFGQDAYFHVNEIITADETWPTDKPHVIYNYCAVDSSIKLTLLAGTQVHGYNNALLYIYKGSLESQGVLGNEVVFTQARSEDFLLAQADSTAGQWRGIYFLAPKQSYLNYTRISNATIGIQVDTLSVNDSVRLENVRIDNSSFAALVTQGGNIYANSCIFGNSGSYSAYISIGGSAYFDHCTFANYFPGQRNTALFVVKDYYEASANNIQYRPFNKMILKNSIVFGPNETEIVFDTLSRVLTAQAPEFFIQNTLIKSEDPVANTEFFESCWRNLDPGFADTFYWDFHTNSSAPVDNKGTSTTPINDLDGNSRLLSGNDLGSYNE